MGSDRLRQRGAFLVAALTALMVQSCVYSFQGNLPAHLESIAIPLVENQTAEYQINETITNLLTQQFLEENILRVENRENADSVLEGVVTSIEDTPYTYDAAERVEEYRVDITLQIRWYDGVQDKTRLEESVNGWGTYDARQATTTREDGIAEAIDMIADKIINSITANW